MKDFFDLEDKGRDHERSKSLLDLVGESKMILFDFHSAQKCVWDWDSLQSGHLRPQ